jgi:hypothetical protein
MAPLNHINSYQAIRLMAVGNSNFLRRAYKRVDARIPIKTTSNFNTPIKQDCKLNTGVQMTRRFRAQQIDSRLRRFWCRVQKLPGPFQIKRTNTQWHRRRAGHATADQVPVCWSLDFDLNPLYIRIQFFIKGKFLPRTGHEGPEG